MCQSLTFVSVTVSCCVRCCLSLSLASVTVSCCVIPRVVSCRVMSDAVGQEPPVPEPSGAGGEHEEAPAEDPAEDAPEPPGGEEGADREPRGSH